MYLVVEQMVDYNNGMILANRSILLYLLETKQYLAQRSFVLDVRVMILLGYNRHVVAIATVLLRFELLLPCIFDQETGMFLDTLGGRYAHAPKANML